MKLGAFTRGLAFVLGLGGLTQAWATGVDHYSFSAIASPQRIGAPLAVTVSALDASGGLVTNFSGPVQLFFTNNATPVYFNDFANGFPFDTDGDGTSDGCEWRSISGSGLFYGTYGFNLHSNTVYSLSYDQAVSPGGTSQLLFSPDAILYYGINPGQIGAWGGWFPPGQVSRYFPYTEFSSMGEGAHNLMLRYWLPQGGSTSIYTDNIKVRVRDVSPGVILFQGGQWTGNLTPFASGSNLVLRALDNHGHSGESNPFDVLPRAADVSVSLLHSGPSAVGPQYTWLSFLVSNAGPSSIEGVVVTNEIPPDLTFIQTDPYGGSQVDSTHVVTTLPTIPGGSALTFSLVVERFQAGPAPVTASLTAPDYDTNPANQFASGSFLFVPVLNGPDVTVSENPGGTNAVFQFTLNATNNQDVAVSYSVAPLSATPGVDYLPPPPGVLVFPAGSTQQPLVVPVLQDQFYEANEQFAVNLSLTNGTPLILSRTNFLGTIISDNALPTLTVALPGQVLESAGTLTNAGSFSISAPFEQDLWLTVTSGNTARVLSPGGVLLPAGQTNATFNLPLVDDHTWNAAQVVTLTVSCNNGMSGSASVTVLNDDPPALSLTAGFKPAEGNGTVTNGLRVLVPFALGTNLTITLASSDTTEMMVPDSVVLSAGATYASFSPTVIDDTEADGPQPVTISASAPGFLSGTLNMTVNDNDLHHFALRSGQGQSIPNQTSQVPFRITLYAQDLASNILSGYSAQRHQRPGSRPTVAGPHHALDSRHLGGQPDHLQW